MCTNKYNLQSGATRVDVIFRAVLNRIYIIDWSPMGNCWKAIIILLMLCIGHSFIPNWPVVFCFFLTSVSNISFKQSGQSLECVRQFIYLLICMYFYNWNCFQCFAELFTTLKNLHFSHCFSKLQLSSFRVLCGIPHKMIYHHFMWLLRRICILTPALSCNSSHQSKHGTVFMLEILNNSDLGNTSLQGLSLKYNLHIPELLK